MLAQIDTTAIANNQRNLNHINLQAMLEILCLQKMVKAQCNRMQI